MEMGSFEICKYCLICALSAITVLVWVRRRRLPPGPLALPLIGHLHLLEANVHQCFSKLSDRYGPLMTIKLGMKTCVIVSSSAMAKQILREHDQTFANRSVPLTAKCISNDGAGILWSQHGPRWRLLRKICVRELFNSKSLEAFYSLRKSVVHRTIRSIYNESINGGSVDVRATAFRTSRDVITNIMWSQTSATSTKRNWEEFEDILADIVPLLGAPNVSDLFPFLKMFDLQGLYRKAQQAHLRVDRFLEGIIEERLSGLSTGNDFLQCLLELMKSGVDGEGAEILHITITDVKGVLLDMISGATETTSNTVEWAMAELLRHPETMRRAQKELKDVVGVKKMVEESDIPNLPYLQAVVKEVLRLHPVLPLLAPHSPDKACFIGGYHIPKDTQVLINVWKMHRNPQAWEDPLGFNPERFVESRRDYNGRDFDYMPFGAGRRICVGLPMGAGMVHYTLASLLHCFEWSVPAGKEMEMAEKESLVLHKAVPVIAIPKPRLLQPQHYY